MDTDVEKKWVVVVPAFGSLMILTAEGFVPAMFGGGDGRPWVFAEEGDALVFDKADAHARAAAENATNPRDPSSRTTRLLARAEEL